MGRGTLLAGSVLAGTRIVYDRGRRARGPWVGHLSMVLVSHLSIRVSTDPRRNGPMRPSDRELARSNRAPAQSSMLTPNELGRPPQAVGTRRLAWSSSRFDLPGRERLETSGEFVGSAGTHRGPSAATGPTRASGVARQPHSWPVISGGSPRGELLQSGSLAIIPSFTSEGREARAKLLNVLAPDPWAMAAPPRCRMPEQDGSQSTGRIARAGR